MPRLVIIGGPNGAGKSTTSADLLEDFNIEAFDFDKRFYRIWGRFDFDAAVERGAREQAAEEFETHLKDAFQNKSDVAFETNFHDPLVLEHVKRAKSLGYEVELVFIGLESEVLAIERVQKRVDSGGHFVDPKTVRERYKAGMSLLDKSYNSFDTIRIYESPKFNLPVKKCIAIDASTIMLMEHPSFMSKLPTLSKFLRKNKDKQNDPGFSM